MKLDVVAAADLVSEAEDRQPAQTPTLDRHGHRQLQGAAVDLVEHQFGMASSRTGGRVVIDERRDPRLISGAKVGSNCRVVGIDFEGKVDPLQAVAQWPSDL